MMSSVVELAPTPDVRQRLREELYALLAWRRRAVLEHAAGLGAAEDEALTLTDQEPGFDRLEHRIVALRHALDRTGPDDTVKSAAATAGLGTRVAVRWDDGAEETYTLVEPVASDPRHGWISTESPVGRGLLGRRPGERVAVDTPGGHSHLDVLAIM